MTIGIAWAAINLTASMGLAVAGLGALRMWLRPSPTQPFPPRIALMLGAVFSWLAMDEGLELHDRFGRWLWREHGVVAPGPIHHVDDMIMLGYLFGAVVLGLVLLPALLRRPLILGAFLLSGALLAVSTFSDALGPRAVWSELVEESSEAVAGVILAITLLRAAVRDGARLPATTARASGDILAAHPRAFMEDAR